MPIAAFQYAIVVPFNNVQCTKLIHLHCDEVIASWDYPETEAKAELHQLAGKTKGQLFIKSSDVFDLSAAHLDRHCFGTTRTAYRSVRGLCLISGFPFTAEIAAKTTNLILVRSSSNITWTQVVDAFGFEGLHEFEEAGNFVAVQIEHRNADGFWTLTAMVNEGFFGSS